MPMYDAKCYECDVTVEFFRHMADCDDIPKCPECDQVMKRVFSVPMVSMDIQPYRPVTPDIKTGEIPVINSRRQHQEFLKRNGLRQFEADSSAGKPDTKKQKQERRDDILHAINKVTG